MSAELMRAVHASRSVHDKDHAAPFKNHIITRMLHVSLNAMRAGYLTNGKMRSFHFLKNENGFFICTVASSVI